MVTMRQPRGRFILDMDTQALHFECGLALKSAASLTSRKHNRFDQ